MTPQEVKEKFETQAKERLELLSEISNRTTGGIEKAFLDHTEFLIRIIGFDTGELSLHRELEQHIRFGTITSEIATKIMKELIDYRAAMEEANKDLAGKLDPRLELGEPNGRPN